MPKFNKLRSKFTSKALNILNITKTASSGTISAGSNVTLTIIVKNTSKDRTARNVTVANVTNLSGNFTSVSVKSVFYGAKFYTILGDIAPLQQRTIIATFKIADQINPGIYYSQVSVKGDNTIQVYEIVNLSVPPPITLNVTQTASKTDVNPGDIIQYNITITNIDLMETARNIVLIDKTTLPGTFSGDDVCQLTADGFRCTLGDIGPGNSRNLTISFTVNDTVISGGYVNELVVNADNAAISTTSMNINVIVPVANLQLTTSVNSSEIRSGDELIFTVSLSNQGPNIANNVVISGITTIEGVFDPSVMCEFTSKTFVCSIGDINVNETRELYIPFMVNNDVISGNYTMDITISASNSPSVKEGVTFTIIPETILTIDTNVNNTNPSIGETVNFDVILRNTANIQATDINITTSIPIPGSINSQSIVVPSGFTSTLESGGVVVFSGNQLAVGAEVVFRFSFTISNQAVAEVYNVTTLLIATNADKVETFTYIIVS